MSKIAFLYPGQGAQKAGMGADFYEKSEVAACIYDRASEVLNIDMKQLCFEENELLDQTEYTQAAMVTTCLAMTRVIESRGLKADITAGLSLGEYSAIAVAGGMSDLDAIRLVRARGILMQNTVPQGEGTMCAVMGMDKKQIEDIVEPLEGVTIANYNSPSQIVITGETASVKEASELLKEGGAKRVIPLNVSGPFHSPMLKPAGEKIAIELDRVSLRELRIPYVTNVSAEKIVNIHQTKELLKTQISSPVLWMQSIESMIQDGIDTFVEIGPGRTLAGFLKKINRDVTVYNISTWEEMETVAEKIGRESIC